MAELTVTGPQPEQQLRWPLSLGEAVRIGRAPRFGCQIPWDQKISREQADVVWEGDHLEIKCLDAARNLVLFEGGHFKDLIVSAGQSFQIGDTTFVVEEDGRGSSQWLREYAFASDELQDVAFGDPPHQMQVLSRLPQLIATWRTDEEMAEQLVDLLLQAIPRAEAAAVVQYDDLRNMDSRGPTMIAWRARDSQVREFAPSRRLVKASLFKGTSILHIWKEEETEGQKYTASGDLDWAICSPLAGEELRGCCVYVSGGSAFIIADSLKGDVRFVDLMGQFISSFRQVRDLRKKQAKMSNFFSAAVVETLGSRHSQSLLEPKEGEISVLFCDVRGFAEMTERASDNLLSLLDRVSQALGIMTSEIVKFEGIIADFQGDAALGFWGWPLPIEEGALPACQAALAILTAFRRVAGVPQHLLSQFQVGIGIAHGRGIAGMIGPQVQSKIGVFGPIVNLGARLQSLTRQMGVPILIDEATANQIRTHMPASEARCRALGCVQPYGMNQPTHVSELLPSADLSQVSDQNLADTEAAVRAMAAGDWPQARQLLERLPLGDGPREFLLDYMAAHDHRPPSGWKGVMVLHR